MCYLTVLALGVVAVVVWAAVKILKSDKLWQWSKTNALGVVITMSIYHTVFEDNKHTISEDNDGHILIKSKAFGSVILDKDGPLFWQHDGKVENLRWSNWYGNHSYGR
jgi:hypothetical protein